MRLARSHHHRRDGGLTALVQSIVPAPWKRVERLTDETSFWRRFKIRVIGGARSLRDRSLFHKLALVPVLAWVGMGADGMSSSAYGPEESFKALGTHLYVAPLVILASVLTIAIIAIAYSRVIEHFPHGGGGYVVASRLLGAEAGVVSGCALIVDYVLTISVSVAAGGDALFSYLPPAWSRGKLGLELATLMAMMILNLRGVRESVLSVAPVFFAFVASHILLIVSSVVLSWGQAGQVAAGVGAGWSQGLSSLGSLALLAIFFQAYSRGAGTYTGIEAVSNGLGILREPQVRTGKRTMLYMAVSLAVASGGLFLGYLLVGVHPVEGETLNAVLAKTVFGGGTFGAGAWPATLIAVTLLSEAGLLIIAAQTGFIDGPRVMANMAVDSWLPRRFSALSERLTMQNGVLLFGIGSIASLVYTGGSTEVLVLMYSINVFITFSLTELSMVHFYWSQRAALPAWRNKIAIHVIGLALCSSILVLMVVEKFSAGGWLTMAITLGLLACCLWMRRYYRSVRARLDRLDRQLLHLPIRRRPTARRFDAARPTAILLVDRFGGVGIHAVFSILRSFPRTFGNVVFVSVGVVDSGVFKGADSLGELRAHVEADLRRYTALARRLGFAARYEMTIGTDVVQAGSDLCLAVARRLQSAIVFGAQLVFQHERWYHRLLHNQTGRAIQSRLQYAGVPMMVLPVRVFEDGGSG